MKTLIEAAERLIEACNQIGFIEDPFRKGRLVADISAEDLAKLATALTALRNEVLKAESRTRLAS